MNRMRVMQQITPLQRSICLALGGIQTSTLTAKTAGQDKLINKIKQKITMLFISVLSGGWRG